jgi:S-formylglutathione hydrolase FrmB
MMKYNFVFVELVFFVSNWIEYAISDAPNFVSGCGLTVLSSTQVNTQLYEVFVSSEEVRGNQTIRILFPDDYTTSGASRRYPVLYLLHGAHQNARAWTTDGTAQEIIGNSSLITVMPNGDPVAFYTNWVIPGNSTPQNWRTYHMEQLVPWIDLNLRTVARKQARAIAGLSMGGYGAIHYAELYSNNFIYAASFSGPLDLLDSLVQIKILNLTNIDGKPISCAFGDPLAPLSSNGWFAESTITRAAELHDIYIALYNGNNGYPEFIYRDGFYRLQDLLVLFNIPVHFDDYGNGQSIGHGCDGSHSWACFRASFIDVLPRMTSILQQQY